MGGGGGVLVISDYLFNNKGVCAFSYKNIISFSKVYAGQGSLLGYQIFPS